MRLIVDLHIHSKYSRATSKDLDLEHIYKWGKLKGIQVIGTGDFTHPAWYEELRTKLVWEEETGLYRLNPELAKEIDAEIPASCRDNDMRFMPTVEISNIYKRHGKVRRLHNVVVVPNLEVAAVMNGRLQEIGNLQADGRPMLGLDSEELLKIMLESQEHEVPGKPKNEALFIPAHIWTPWYAMFGSKSGFDSLEEAFGDNVQHIHAVETGLSADPRMCRQVSNLEGVTLVSHSDAHSPGKLGREANMMDCELSYEAIIGGIKSGDERMVGTVEFFPEEGKYHEDGCAQCGFSCSPEKTRELRGNCPSCGRVITVGVLSRVGDLSDQQAEDSAAYKSKKVQYIVPLPEVLAELGGVKSVTSKKVIELYGQVTQKLGSDFDILLQTPLEQIKEAGFEELAEAVRRIRSGEVFVKPGYDGIFGVVKVFGSDGVASKAEKQMSLF